MLEAETKRRIDTARDILVGKVPDPKSQVEQITIALIYKFMDDMDKESISMGGNPSFFVGEYEKYSWTKIFNPRLGGYEMLSLYSEAITRLSQNPNLPLLFRDIFKNAYLPYRDPETLKLFLKTINEFVYDHSERLGDAYEYLLAILGSQGDAGQFLTPRHIINFMVQVVDPKKDETILDPACGTAGFLISAYRHIVQANTDKTPGDLFTIDERKKLASNIKGYDIAPDMVRLSLVNMYLHGFTNPLISEYDTLTSEDKWGEYADVILANPPFMTPKGGIKPHKRFSVQSNRSEVLFVDYIAEHLTPNGRAAVIVPDGVIFQSGKAYKQLRKELVEKYLWAVISLPSGVFKPYSGVKTSIFFLDRQMSKKADNILFIKIENDGFDLGDQRRPIDKNDLPEAVKELNKYVQMVKAGNSMVFPAPGKAIDTLLVNRNALANSGEYNLTAERYKEKEPNCNQKWPFLKVGDIVSTITPPRKLKTDEYEEEGLYPIIDQSQKYITGWSNDERAVINLDSRAVVIFGDHTCAVKYVDFPFIQGADGIKILRPAEIVNAKYLYYVLRTKPILPEGYNRHYSKLVEYELPIPTLEIQKEVVAEIEEYQKIIDGARQVVENWKPRIEVNPEWPTEKLGEFCEIIAGQSPDGATYNSIGEGIPFYQGKTEFTDKFLGPPQKWTTSATKIAEKGDVLISVRAPVGPVNICTERVCIGRGLAAIRVEAPLADYLFYILKSMEDKIKGGGGSTFDAITKKGVEEISVCLPPDSDIEAILSDLDVQYNNVSGCKDLIARFSRKITGVVNGLW